MIRWSIAALLALNGALLAWNLATAWGWDADSQRDAQRVKLQIRPEAIQIVPPDAPAQSTDMASPAAAPASAAAQ